MANLNVNNYNNIKLNVNKDEYWDFFINKDSFCNYSKNDYISIADACKISSVDLSKDECFKDNDWIVGEYDYVWDDSTAIKHTLYNISYVGVDNGLFTFRKDRISNKDFLNLFQSNKYDIDENDYRLKLHAVSGNTLQYDYPLSREEDCVKFNGGFYQGFFKTECDKYQILPSSFEDGETINLEFKLKKCELDKESNRTLNDKYPNNKGIFFYIGTRSENKWIYLYDTEDVDGLEKCFELGVDDYVEDGSIDKKDYIIGNFYDPNPDFDGYDPFELGDYTNYIYYEPQITLNTSLTMPNYTILTWCCGDDSDLVVPSSKRYFSGCACSKPYKMNNRTNNHSDNSISMCEEFGDNYVADDEDIMSLDEAVEYIEPELDITDFEYETDNGFKLSEANQYYFYTDNKFLMFDRTKNGMTVQNWVDGTEFMYYGRKNHFKGNLFILMNRTKTGYTINNIDDLRNKDANYYNPYNDLYDNALAFRITDDGEIGYRLITIDCQKEGRDKTQIVEGYSNKNIIPNCEWITINIRISFIGGNKMKFMFYINGKLMYVTKELPKINLRKLNDLYEKQEGVPYNISIGGGTQGLAETIQYNYMLNPTRTYPLEENFGGTFIGYIKSFKIYNCFLSQPIIQSLK